MVTDEERDYMYRAYAHDSEMRINLGIRRRLAPLVGNDRRKMELLHGLLFSLPGTPVLYYGDEIGMGDNVFLGDRNGVRTPMQWSADRNAGFSRANPQRLILPIIIDPEYHYEAINVEAQQNNPNSLLWWTKRLVALRKQFQRVRARHHGVPHARELPRAGVRPRAATSARERSWSSPTCRASRSTSSWTWRSGRGCARSSCSGTPSSRRSASCPTCSRSPGYAFYWFSLEPPPSGGGEEEAAAYVPPVLAGKSAHSLLVGEEQVTLEDALGDFLATRRWFGGRGFRVTAVHIEEAVALGGVFVLVVRVEYADRDAERYVLPLATVTEAAHVAPHAVVATLRPARRRSAARRRDGGRPVGARAAGGAGRARARPGAGGTVDATPLTELEVARGRARQHQRPARRRGGPLRRSLPAEDVPPPRGRRRARSWSSAAS